MGVNISVSGLTLQTILLRESGKKELLTQCVTSKKPHDNLVQTFRHVAETRVIKDPSHRFRCAYENMTGYHLYTRSRAATAVTK